MGTRNKLVAEGKPCTTVCIEGNDYPYFGMTENRLGIITENRTFWMYPICHIDGSTIDGLPVVGPEEVKCVTFDEPDLTNKYIKEARADYKKHLQYWEKMTQQKYIVEFGPLPENDHNGNSLSFDDFKQRRQEVTFEDFRAKEAKSNAWLRHRTKELATKHNYREPSFLYATLHSKGMEKGKAELVIQSIKYEVHYPSPEESVIFLKDLKDDCHTPEAKQHVLASRNKQAIEAHGVVPPSEHRESVKNLLHKLVQDGEISMTAFRCYNAYIAEGNLYNGAKRARVPRAKFREHLRTCEQKTGTKIVKTPHGGPGIIKERYHDDRLNSQGWGSDETVTQESDSDFFPSEGSEDFPYDNIDVEKTNQNEE